MTQNLKIYLYSLFFKKKKEHICKYKLVCYYLHFLHFFKSYL